MKSLIRDIRKQPEHIRKTYMWVMIVMVFSIVGAVWFISTRNAIILASRPYLERAHKVDNSTNHNKSQFAQIGIGLEEIVADIKNFFAPLERRDVGSSGNANIFQNIDPQELPTAN